MHLSIVEQTETLTFVRLEGSLDHAAAHEIEARFLAETAARKKSVVVDFSGVDFVGSIGMRLLIAATKPLYREGKKLVILNPRPEVEKILEHAGMTNVLEISHDEAAARAQASN